MSDIEDLKSLGTPRLKNREGKPTWLICVIKREYSTYTSTRILNGNNGNEDSLSLHPEAKFFDFWWKNPRKIFPDLPFNEIDRRYFNLIWYTLTSPCNHCVQLIIGNQHLFNNLTIFTASVYRNVKDSSMEARNRVFDLRGKGVMVEPISPGEYFHFTTGRAGHELPQLSYFNPGQDFVDSRIPFSGDTTINTDTEVKFSDSFETPVSPPRYEPIFNHKLVQISNDRTVCQETFPYHGCPPHYHPQLPNTYPIPLEEAIEPLTTFVNKKRPRKKLKRLKRSIFIEDS